MAYMASSTSRWLIPLLICLSLTQISSVHCLSQQYRGVNLAGGEFNYRAKRPADIYGKNYIYPGAFDIKYVASKGSTVIRLPVRWERLQPALNSPLDADEMARVDRVITEASRSNLAVIIDIHNFGKFKGQSIGLPTVSVDSFLDLWKRLANRYRDNPTVIFGLMNEPFDIAADDWAAVAQKAILAIRATKANNLVLVPGTAWSGAHSWLKPVRGIPNGIALQNFNDPANNFAFDFHQYFDRYSSGTLAECVSPDQAVLRLSVATGWLRRNKAKGFLSEFAVSASPDCQPVMSAALAHVSENKEWIGWTYWASSAWFGTYIFNVYPVNGKTAPQMTTLAPYLQP